MTSPKTPPPPPEPSILICRNKHFPYIASYHGPWLSLPLELFHSLLTINVETGISSAGVYPVDRTIFQNLLAIRKLVDEASELVIKASGNSSPSNHHSYHHHGGNSGNDGGRVGNKVSPLRQQRLRELAVGKLAMAYKIDEIGTSVLTMQSASALDDVAIKVLKKSPTNVDALYVNYFHEKIPSRMLATYTTTETLDRIIQAYPTTPEYYRTRAMVYGFLEEFPQSLRDYKSAISLLKKRKKMAAECEVLTNYGNSNINNSNSSSNSNSNNGGLGDLEDAGACESQLYFLRAACFHQYAISLIDKTIQNVNEAWYASKRAGSAAAVPSGEPGSASKKSKKKKKKKSGSASSATIPITPTAASKGTTPNSSEPSNDPEVEQMS
ncbi:hypothetical protein HDV05_002220, partial [Chytridiales sp. JEL 0842]